METLTLRDLSFTYPGSGEQALSHVDLAVPQGGFCVLCGPSGGGKSTLLRLLKPALAPKGLREGEILFQNTPIEALDCRFLAREIGFVGQSPEDQLVTDKVWHELAFGLESLGLDTPAIRRRVAEMAAFFGIQTWFDRSVTDLSGGQKQLLNLASVMVMQPSLLLLDEPTAQLDPIAASSFLSMLGRLNRELGTTIVMAEHCLESAFPLATQAAVLDAGRLLCQGTPREVILELKRSGHPMFAAMPVPARVWASVKDTAPPPITVREGRDWLEAYAAGHPLSPLPEAAEYPRGEAVIRAKDLWFRYEKTAPDVVKGLSLTAHRGELLALLGGNGTGKTTALNLLSGGLRPYRGTVEVHGRCALLPQSVKALFVENTVEKDLRAPGGEDLTRVIALCGLEPLLDRHPYDLSGGEQQRLALAKLLLTDPDILLLDEPTRGLDPAFRQTLGELLNELCAMGKTVVLVSHDLEFCARYAHRCALIFDGGVLAEDTPRAFFAQNRFYTTAANRMARPLLPDAVTADDLISACGGDLPTIPPPGPSARMPAEPPAADAATKRPGGTRRAVLTAVLFLLMVPLTIYGGLHLLDSRKYTVISLLVLLEAMLPFYLLFERRKPSARELAVLAALCAIAVAGRAALFMLPQCKPVIAVAVVAGAALGSETGFLVGSVSMLVSNMLFGQGPWTPWQMFAVGIIGAGAGLMFFLRKRKNITALALFGAAASLVLYGGIMNTSSALLWADPPTWPILLSYYAAGLPMDCVQAAATFLFLRFAAAPMLEKLERLRTRYALYDT